MGKSKASPDTAISSQLEVDALDLRKQRFTFREIGQQLGCSESWAARLVKKRLADLDEHASETAEEIRKQEAESLDEHEKRLVLMLEQSSDPDTCMKLTEKVIRVKERRAKLLGLDMPKQMDVTSGGEPLVQLYIPTDGSAEG